MLNKEKLREKVDNFNNAGDKYLDAYVSEIPKKCEHEAEIGHNHFIVDPPFCVYSSERTTSYLQPWWTRLLLINFWYTERVRNRDKLPLSLLSPKGLKVYNKCIEAGLPVEFNAKITGWPTISITW